MKEYKLSTVFQQLEETAGVLVNKSPGPIEIAVGSSMPDARFNNGTIIPSGGRFKFNTGSFVAYVRSMGVGNSKAYANGGDIIAIVLVDGDSGYNDDLGNEVSEKDIDALF